MADTNLLQELINLFKSPPRDSLTAAFPTEDELKYTFDRLPVYDGSTRWKGKEGYKYIQIPISGGEWYDIPYYAGAPGQEYDVNAWLDAVLKSGALPDTEGRMRFDLRAMQENPDTLFPIIQPKEKN